MTLKYKGHLELLEFLKGTPIAIKLSDKSPILMTTTENGGQIAE